MSLVPGAGRPNFDPDSVDNPHDLASVDFAILPGQFGVAENAAIWVTDKNLLHRAIYFIVQHLALVIPADQIVDNMHQAYERLSFLRTRLRRLHLRPLENRRHRASPGDRRPRAAIANGFLFASEGNIVMRLRRSQA